MGSTLKEFLASVTWGDENELFGAGANLEGGELEAWKALEKEMLDALAFNGIKVCRFQSMLRHMVAVCTSAGCRSLGLCDQA